MKTPPIQSIGNGDYTEAVRILADGGLVAFPTETVYGLGADASNPAAVEKVFAAKGRPADHPLIVHVADMEMAEHWVDHISDAARKMMEAFWPGPLTFILPKAAHVSGLITAGQDTVAVRCPNHPVAQSLLRAFGGALVAPSANKYTRISPTTAEHVQNSFFASEIDYIIDGGACTVGIESTIIDMTDSVPTIVRLGVLDAPTITTQVQVSVLTAPARVGADRSDKKVAGSALAHYAPYAKLHILDAKGIVQYILQAGTNEIIGVWHYHPLTEHMPVAYARMAPTDAVEYAQQLYAILHEMDQKEVDTILIEKPPVGYDWMAIHDRLQRASYGSGL